MAVWWTLLQVNSMAKAIQAEYDKRGSYDRQKIRKYAENNFSFQKQGDAYMDVYKKLLKNNI